MSKKNAKLTYTLASSVFGIIWWFVLSSIARLFPQFNTLLTVITVFIIYASGITTAESVALVFGRQPVKKTLMTALVFGLKLPVMPFLIYIRSRAKTPVQITFE